MKEMRDELLKQKEVPVWKLPEEHYHTQVTCRRRRAGMSG